MAEVCTLLSAIQVDLYYQTFAGLQFKTSWKILFISLIRYGSVSCTANIRTQTFTRFFSFYMILCLFLIYLSTEASDNLLYPEGGNTVTKKKKGATALRERTVIMFHYRTAYMWPRSPPPCLSVCLRVCFWRWSKKNQCHTLTYTPSPPPHTHTHKSQGVTECRSAWFCLKKTPKLNYIINPHFREINKSISTRI